ncbi:hypothetical protein [Pectobacterium versatile]|uniref:hypothetical protein n=1 Tax=Pectobacterium versatile TaxID=2488639 RepID=UPI00386C5F52
MSFRPSIIQYLHIRYKGITELISWFAFGFLLLTEHAYLAFFVLFLLSIVKIAPISTELYNIAKNAYVIRFYNIIIWFLSYIFSLKSLSYQTGIMEENLKFAPGIIAFPLSLVLMFSIIMIFSLLMLSFLQITSCFSILMTEKFKNKILESQFYLISTRLFYIIPILFPIIAGTSYISEPIVKIALLSDSSFSSDCGEKRRDKMYIRIDSHSCMVSTLDINIFTSPLEIIKSEKK